LDFAPHGLFYIAHCGSFCVNSGDSENRYAVEIE
jgi:hypothetical protein